jgi:hypothetical protein
MKRAVTTLTIVGTLLVFTVSSSGQGSDEAAPVLGRLAIDGVVSVHAGPGDIEVSAPSYPYRGGDRIGTGDHSTAVLTLRDGSIAIAPDTSLSVAGGPSRYRIDLEAGGALRIRSNPGAAFELASGEVRMRFPAPLAKGSDEAKPVDVMIAVREDGVVAADAYQGAVELSDLAGGLPRVVAEGESEVLRVGRAPVSANDEKDLRERLAPWLIGTGSVVGAGGLGVGIYYLTTDDGDDDDDTSPVR